MGSPGRAGVYVQGLVHMHVPRLHPRRPGALLTPRSWRLKPFSSERSVDLGEMDDSRTGSGNSHSGIGEHSFQKTSEYSEHTCMHTHGRTHTRTITRQRHTGQAKALNDIR